MSRATAVASCVNTQGVGDRSGDLVVVENFITELRAALAAGKTQ